MSRGRALLYGWGVASDPRAAEREFLQGRKLDLAGSRDAAQVLEFSLWRLYQGGFLGQIQTRKALEALQRAHQFGFEPENLDAELGKLKTQLETHGDIMSIDPAQEGCPRPLTGFPFVELAPLYERAEAGDPVAMAELSHIFQIQAGVPIETELNHEAQAGFWKRRAQAGGYVFVDDAKDFQETDWLEEARFGGYLPYFRLAEAILDNDYDVNSVRDPLRNPEMEAIDFSVFPLHRILAGLEKAADNGYRGAWYYLGSLHERFSLNADEEREALPDEPLSTEQALQYYNKGMDQGCKASAYELGAITLRLNRNDFHLEAQQQAVEAAKYATTGPDWDRKARMFLAGMIFDGTAGELDDRDLALALSRASVLDSGFRNYTLKGIGAMVAASIHFDRAQETQDKKELESALEMALFAEKWEAKGSSELLSRIQSEAEKTESSGSTSDTIPQEILFAPTLEE